MAAFRFKSNEAVIAQDLYKTKVLLHRNVDGVSFDLQTDGRILLTSDLARYLARELVKFADWVESPRGGGKE